MATTDIYTVMGSTKPNRSAVRFLGGNTDDYVQIDAFTAARVAANDAVGTFTAWVMMPDIAGTYTIIGNGDNNVVEFLELNVENGLLTARCTDATVVQFITQADAVGITPHKWHHVAMVQAADGYGPKLYIDGKQIAATNDDATDVNEWYVNLDGLDKGLIGASNKSGDASITQEFKGFISDVKYWNVALTAEQIEGEYMGTPYATGLISHWNMNNGYTSSNATYNGTAVSDVILISDANQFTSRLQYRAGIPVVADKILIGFEEGVGHAVVIKAA